MSEECLQLDVSTFQEPVVLKQCVEKWKMKNFTIKDWCDVFKGQSLQFRKGSKEQREEPLWESECEVATMTLDNFFASSEKENNYFLYFDYKYMKDIFTNDVLKVRWSDLDLDVYGQDSTIWIGSKGAHTPCHMDTYGCNFVAQLLGRKRWILIPPERTNIMESTRVPYEESSVYSSINFYTPSENILRLSQVYQIDLIPGDILYVPKNWWHYVENLDTAISVNTWLPMKSDDKSRISEAMIQSYISNVCQELTEDEAKSILNPNEFDKINESFNLNILESITDTYFSKLRENQKPITIHKNINFCKVTKKDISVFYEEKLRQLKNTTKITSKPLEARAKIARALINSFCNPETIETATNNYLKEIKK